MYKDVDHVCVCALVNALRKDLLMNNFKGFPIAGVPLSIQYMDRSHSLSGSMEHQIELDAGLQPLTEEPIVLLYRPGHYDVLYK